MRFAWLLYVLIAAAAWGAYAPVVHHGQLALGERNNPNAPVRAFLFVGFAYFLLAIVVPVLWLAFHREPAGVKYPAGGVILCVFAGALSAVGALAVIFALRSGGLPIYVAPLVFAGAPIDNVAVAMLWDGVDRRPDVRFFLGILLAAAGGALVLRYQPAPREDRLANTPSVVTAPAAPSSAVETSPTRPA
jgi:hypothetical protein